MARLGRRDVLAACSGILVAGCFGRDPDAPGTADPTDTPAETPRTSATPTSTGDVEVRWDTFVPGQYSLAAPAIADGSLYLGSREEMRALALGDGTVQWEAPLDALTHPFTPAVADGVVYAGARDMIGRSLQNEAPGVLAALEGADGSERWRVEVRITGPPTVTGDAVLIPTTDRRPALGAFATADGAERWRVPLDDAGDVFAPPAVADGLAIAGTVSEDGGRVVALDATDGSEVWALNPPGSVQAAPAVEDGVAYLATDAGDLRALAVADGTERWQADLGGPIRTSPAVADGSLYVAVGDTVRALALEDGSERWTATVGAVSRTGLSVGDGSVYSGGDRISALSAADGTRRWVQHLEGLAGTFGAPVYRDGVLYTGACIKQDGDDPYDHHVYALAEKG